MYIHKQSLASLHGKLTVTFTNPVDVDDSEKALVELIDQLAKDSKQGS